MTWVRIEDSFPDHPKALEAGPLACWLYVCGLAYACRYLTDGFIPDRQVNRLSDVAKPGSQAQALVRAGLWEVVEGGYRIHDYLDYQPSAEKVEKEREATRKRVEAHRNRNSGKFASNGEVTPLQERDSEECNDVTNGTVTTAPSHTHSNNLSVGADAPQSDVKALPRNGPAQSLVACWYGRAGGKPASYGKAVGQAQQLVDAGVDEAELIGLYDHLQADAFWVKGFDLGIAVSQLDKFRQSKTPRQMAAGRSGVPA